MRFSVKLNVRLNVKTLRMGTVLRATLTAAALVVFLAALAVLYRYAAPLMLALSHRTRRPRGGGDYGDAAADGGGGAKRPLTDSLGTDEDSDDKPGPASDFVTDDEPLRWHPATGPRRRGSAADNGGAAKRPRTGLPRARMENLPGARMENVASIDGVLDLITSYLDQPSIDNVRRAGRAYRDAARRADVSDQLTVTGLALDLTPAATFRRPTNMNFAFSPSRDTVAVLGSHADEFSRDKIILFDQSTGAVTRTLDDTRSRPIAIGFSDDGKRLASVHEGSLLTIWNPETGVREKEMRFGTCSWVGLPRIVQFRGDVVVIDCGTTFVCDIARQTVTEGPRLTFGLGPDPESIFYMHNDVHISLYSQKHPRGVVRIMNIDQFGSFQHAACSANGYRIAAITDDEDPYHGRDQLVYLCELYREVGKENWSTKRRSYFDVSYDAQNAMDEIPYTGMSRRHRWTLDRVALSPEGELVVAEVKSKEVDKTVLLVYEFETGALHAQLFDATIENHYGVSVFHGADGGYCIMAKHPKGFIQWDVPPLHRQIMAARRERLLADRS